MKWKWLLNGWNRWQFVSVEIVTSANAQTEINNMTPTTWVHILLLLLLDSENDKWLSVAMKLYQSTVEKVLQSQRETNQHFKLILLPPNPCRLLWLCARPVFGVLVEFTWGTHTHTRCDKINDIAFVIGQNDEIYNGKHSHAHHNHRHSQPKTRHIHIHIQETENE